jgi:Fe/S biogenesis protein NfuA
MTQDDIQKFIDDDVNPALATHGGVHLIHNFDDEKKLLKGEMGGGCQGCASARITLKLQIEGFLKEEFPELTEIEDVTDHIAGTNPYY